MIFLGRVGDSYRLDRPNDPADASLWYSGRWPDGDGFDALVDELLAAMER